MLSPRSVGGTSSLLPCTAVLLSHRQHQSIPQVITLYARTMHSPICYSPMFSGKVYHPPICYIIHSSLDVHVKVVVS